MTEIIRDDVAVTMEIDGDPWLLVEAEVELSRISVPNYVRMIMIPDPEETRPNLPSPIDKLLGKSFRLEADNTMITERDTDAEEDNLLFEGELANISPTGEKSYEGIAYDPGQQAFAPEEDGGSIMNEYISVGKPEYSYTKVLNDGTQTEYKVNTIKASKLIEKTVEKLDIEKYEIEIEEGGVTVDGEIGSYTGGYERNLYFGSEIVKLDDALQQARERTQSEWWFDKDGTFHFGVPRPTRHNLRYITDASDGKTTPPYQSVRLIGSGIASQEGHARTSMETEDKVVKEASIQIDPETNDTTINFDTDGPLKEPVFEYTNLEVTTGQQAESSVQKIAEDIAEQQADGKVTVVGFPEIVPMDGIVMPQASDETAPNYSPDQPMGGYGYNVYKVRHFLNNSDGFVTEIHVGSVTGATKTIVGSSSSGTGEGGDIKPHPGVLKGTEMVR